MRCYKLTDQNCYTYRGTLWVPKVWRGTSGEGPLCSPGWLHAYTHPLLAAFLNPTHARFQNPRLWLAEGKGEVKRDHGLKVGYTRMRVLEELPLPEITTVQRVAFGILCALEISQSKQWQTWAHKWLSGTDRSHDAADAADAAYAAAAADAAADAAAYAAAYAADAAADAAAYAAAYAAAAADAAANAETKKRLPLVRLAKKALTYK